MSLGISLDCRDGQHAPACQVCDCSCHVTTPRVVTSVEERPGDWYRGVAVSYEAYAESDRCTSELSRAACLREAANYRDIGARVDLAMSGENS